jgi:hypothetical protein
MKQLIGKMTRDELLAQIEKAQGYGDINLKEAVIEACKGALGVYTAQTEAMRQYQESLPDMSDMLKVRV